MEDLTAASYDDVVDFFKKYYAPSNASLVVAGDIDPAATRQLVEKWFGDVKPGPAPKPMTIPGVALTGVQKKTITDRVQLPRLYSRVADAAALRAGRRRARRRRRRARRRQELAALQAARLRHADRAERRARSRGRWHLSSHFRDRGHAAARPYGRRAAEGRSTRRSRSCSSEAPIGARVRALAQPDRGVVLQPDGAGRRVRRQGRSDERATSPKTGDPDYFNEDLGRYRALSPSDIRAAAAAFLPRDRRVELIVVPEKAVK